MTPQKLYFDIPYCAGKNANAYNVRLESAVVLRAQNGFKILSKFEDAFPDNITLTYETGKSMSFSLQPLPQDSLRDMYIGVKGTYTDESGTSTYPVFDVFKFNAMGNNWVRLLGDEDRIAKAFFVQIDR